MTAFHYDVRYVNPELVRADLVRVWQNNLPVDEGAEAKFAWIYQQAVDPPPGVFVLAVSDRAGVEDRIVGTAGLGVRSFVLDDRQLRAGLLADLAVDREHRTALPALRLVRGARTAVLRDFDLAYGFPNRSAQAVFLRCGYRKLGTLTRWARVLGHAPYVHKVVPVAPFSRLAGAALDVGNLVQLAARSLPARRRSKLEWLHGFDSRFDRLWQDARGSYTLIGQRDAAFLRWRFDQPGHRFQIASLVDRRDSTRLLAYTVVERVGGACHLRDLFGHPAELGPLLDLLLPSLARRRATSASIGFLGSDAIGELLASRGFRERESERVIVYDVSPAHAGLNEIASDVQSWHLTDADEDT
jgi:hypothetical protein